MVPDWVRPLAEVWGHELRRFESKAGAIQGTLGRIRDEGPGAAIRGVPDYIPRVDLPRQASKFHRAWVDLPDEWHRQILWIHFKEYGVAKKKWHHMGLSKSTYYRKINNGLEEIARNWYLYD